MMVSLDDYKKIKGEVIQLLSRGSNLLEEDECLLNLISQSNSSKDVLQIAQELKEEGNSLFKERNYDEALERYGYAGVLLTNQEFEEEKDRVGFVELILRILSNIAACLSKRKEYVQVGQTCSIILDYDPKNVKALFRRALAAIELGRKDLAYLDLLLAADIEPKNQEVMKKLEEMKNYGCKNNCSSHSNDEIPRGLGVGLSPPKKMKCSTGINNGMELNERHGIEPFTCKRESDCYSTDQNDLVFDNKEAQGGLDINKKSSLNERVGEVQEKAKDEGVKAILDCENHDLAKPKYRFANRRRPGYSISISTNDYQLLLKGKTIHFVNSKLGSPMSIRVITCPREGLKKGINHDEKVGGSYMVDKGMVKEDVSVDDMAIDPKNQGKMSEVKVQTSDVQDHCNFNNLWSNPKDSCFWFTSTPKIHWRTEAGEKIRKRVIRWKADMDARKKKRTNLDVTSSFITNFGVCRNRAGMKRKLIVPSSESSFHPRKKPLYKSCSVNVYYSPTSNMDYSFVDCISSVYPHGVAFGHE